MIKIKIQQVTTQEYDVVENFLMAEEVVKTPQGDVAYEENDSYSRNLKKAVTNKKYEVKSLVKTREVTVTLLEQEIVSDGAFDLGRVILAINRASVPISALAKGE